MFYFLKEFLKHTHIQLCGDMVKNSLEIKKVTEMPKTVGAVVEDDLLHKLEAICAKENRSMSNVIETLLIEALKKRENENQAK